MGKNKGKVIPWKNEAIKEPPEPAYPEDIEDDLIDRKEGEFIKVTCLVEDWLKESSDLFDISLRFFAVKFELQSVIDSNKI